MKFNEITGLNHIEFSKIGMAEQLLTLIGTENVWNEDMRMTFNSMLLHFTRAYEFRGGSKLPITVGDALTSFINVYGYEAVVDMSDAQLNTNIVKCWNEFVVLTEDQTVGLVMDPGSLQEKKNIFSYLLPTSNSNKKFTVAFLYPKSPETSDWIYAHDLGRSYLEETFPDQMKTICVNDVSEDRIEEVLNDVICQGADIIFEVAPQMMMKSLKVAVDHPDVKILNCSLNTPHKDIRTYYARMYEAKFLSGMIAGALAENDKIAYIADYPIYGMIANINAFALGATFTNPRAQIYLEWSTSKEYDRDRFLEEHDIHIVSDQDMITPRDASRQFGLYRYVDGQTQNLVMPVWNWGVFYEKMIQSILAGSYQSEGNAMGQALNYWWGMSAGVIDLICSKNVPVGVKRLADHLKSDIKKGDIVPFYGEIWSQDQTLRNEKDKAMKPEDVMEMDWLVDNVVGSIPPLETLIDAAQSVVQLKGVEDKK
jgi:basic membrane lipoprotein Med (substrate-binding protein (PBP1-ABC) superfamily)